MFGAVAVNGDSAFADLQQELAVLGELEDLPVSGAVAGQPHIVFVVDRDAVLAAPRTSVAIGSVLLRARGAFREGGKETAAIEPLVASVTRRPAPSLDVLARFAEFHDWRTRRVPVLGRVTFLERVRPVEHPDVAVRVGRRSTDAAHQHPVRQHRKAGVDFEDRQGRLRARFLILRGRAHIRARHAENSQQCQTHQPRARDEWLSHASTLQTG